MRCQTIFSRLNFSHIISRYFTCSSILSSISFLIFTYIQSLWTSDEIYVWEEIVFCVLCLLSLLHHYLYTRKKSKGFLKTNMEFVNHAFRLESVMTRQQQSSVVLINPDSLSVNVWSSMSVFSSQHKHVLVIQMMNHFILHSLERKCMDDDI